MDVIKTMVFCVLVLFAALTYMNRAVCQPMLQEAAEGIAARLPAGAR
jgi:hypothetical protein